ncbi:hypothetical protein [Salinigranum marinum]|uniref:hypothetical protein n=1 Tax=Salinigranum marinum TaxID=1515595 RepID=UPI0029899F74|nr:hypothetical protein [Salinigranum marinum]
MTEERSDRDRPLSLDRRDVLRTIGGAAAAGALATPVGTGRAAADSGGYSAVQGDQCVPMTPLSGDQPVEELYDLRIPDRFTGDNGATDPGSGPYYGSVGTEDLQQEDTTITFLYDGPDGLSLVVVHGAFGGDGGRGVSWTLRGDSLADGEWTVKDDFYLDQDTGEPAGSNYDRWDVSGNTHTIDWTWGSSGTDGGALRPLGDGFDLTIDPAYNEDAALWGDNYYDGEVTDWQVLSFPDGRSSPERTSLALDERVTIRSRACDSTVEAEIDVRSRINPKSRGVVPVALFGTDELDPEDVAVGTLRFGPPGVVGEGDGARAAHGGHLEDVDGTGGDDLVLHFPTPDTGFDGGETTAKLVGETTDGRRIVGTDGVTVQAPEDDEGERGESGEADEDDQPGERNDEGERDEEDRSTEEDDAEGERGADDQGEEENDREGESGEPEGKENGRGEENGRGRNDEKGENGRGDEKGENGRGDEKGENGRGDEKGNGKNDQNGGGANGAGD